MISRIPSNVNPRVYILWLLRSGRVDGWDSLAREFGLDPEFFGTATGILLNYLQSLQNVGLIIIERHADDGPYGAPHGRISLSDKWAQIQAALDLSLTELTKLGPSAIIVTPYFD